MIGDAVRPRRRPHQGQTLHQLQRGEEEGPGAVGPQPLEVEDDAPVLLLAQTRLAEGRPTSIRELGMACRPARCESQRIVFIGGSL